MKEEAIVVTEPKERKVMEFNEEEVRGLAKEEIEEFAKKVSGWTQLYKHQIVISNKGYLEIISTHTTAYKSVKEIRDDFFNGAIIKCSFNFNVAFTDNMCGLYTYDFLANNGIALYGIYHETVSPYTSLVGTSIVLETQDTIVGDTFAPL